MSIQPDMPLRLVTQAPDWAGVTDEIRCPLCGYNLHGLAEPRCPECGYTFDWPDLIDPTRRLHPYLFEHHPERNFRSFWRTAAGAMLPRRFWRTLQPVQPSKPRRLILYWVLTVVVCSVCLHLAAASYVGLLGYADMKSAPVFRSAVLAGQVKVRSPVPEFGPVGLPITDPKVLQRYADQYYPTGLSMERLKWLGKAYVEFGLATHVLLLPLVWPWLMFASLMVFQWSMRRSKVGPVHALRCTIYSGGTLVWAGLSDLACFLAFMGQTYFRPMRGLHLVFPSIALAATGGLLLWMIYQLILAYRLYMRFDHATATVLSALVIALLAPFTAYVLVLAGVPGYLPDIDWHGLGLL